MNSSLKSQLNTLIREKGYLSYPDMVQFCLEEGYKPSNGERRLRASESPNVKPEMKKSKRGNFYIAAYRYDPPKPTFRILSRDEVTAQYQKLI